MSKGSAFGDETEKYGLDDCVWWDEYWNRRPHWARVDCGGRMDETASGVLCENHFNASKGLPL